MILNPDRRLIAFLSLSAGVRNDTNPATRKYNIQGYPRAFRSAPGLFLVDFVKRGLALGVEVFALKGLGGGLVGSEVSGNICPPPEIEADIRGIFLPFWKEEKAKNPNLTLCYYTGSVAKPDLNDQRAVKGDPSCLKSGTDEEQDLWRKRNKLPLDLGVTVWMLDWASSTPELTEDAIKLKTLLNAQDMTTGSPEHDAIAEAFILDRTADIGQMARSTYLAEHPVGVKAMGMSFDPSRSRMSVLLQDHPMWAEEKDEFQKQVMFMVRERGWHFIAQHRLEELVEVAKAINDPGLLCLSNPQKP